MKYLATTVLFLVLFMIAGSAGAAPALERDLQRFQGKWQLVRAKRDGISVPRAEVKATQIAFQGNHFSFSQSTDLATSQNGTIGLNPLPRPPHMDATSSSGTNRGQTHLGIYKFHGNRYTVCFSPPGKERPHKFASRRGTGELWQEWKRIR